ncbi:phosphatidate cytidylyltransferase, mitochondrial-like [Styela clava]
MRILSCLLSNVPIVSNTSSIFQRILMHFPDGGNMSLAFAYGSGVFAQKGHKNPTANMLDFIFAVQDPLKWHSENLSLNQNHYSLLMQKLGAERIAQLQENYGANIFYNTLIICEGRIIKYGIISNEKLESDLLNWDNLYVAGRLHKPVNIIRHRFENNPKLMLAMRRNYHSALYASFLMLPEVFSEWQLYHTIAGLSYLGDFRMKFGEDKNKVSNIVEPNYTRFQDLYHPILESIAADCKEFVSWNVKSAMVEVDSSPKARHVYLDKLPLRVQIRMAREFDRNAIQIRDTEEILRNIARYANIEDPVRDALIYTVKRSSWSQSRKSLIGVGPVKGWKYASQKLDKMWKGMKNSKKLTETVGDT